MYLVARNEVLKSTDHGNSWSSVAQPDQNLSAIAMNPQRSAEGYVISDQGAIHPQDDRWWRDVAAASRRSHQG
jgi:photosystem II stability/assembly factor-like uncharacterized protein